MKKLFLLVPIILTLFLTGCSSQDEVHKNTESKSWERYWGSDKNDIGKDIAVDSTGIYVTGVTLGEMNDNTTADKWDIFLTKYNFEGDLEWTVQWGTEGRDSGNGIATDATGIYVTGEVEGNREGGVNNRGYEIFLAKFNSDGTKLWSVQLGTPENENGKGIALDSTGVYITGYTGGSITGEPSAGKDDIFLAKFDSDGVLQWTRQWGTSDVDWGSDIAVLDSGVYITGFTKGDLPNNRNSGNTDSFLTKYNSDGRQEWTRQWGTENNDEGNGIAVDSTGIYVTGRINGDFDGKKRIGVDDIYIAGFDLSGERQWFELLGTIKNDNAFSIAIGNSALYITGSTFGKFEGNNNSGYSDIFLATYNLSGGKQSIKQWGTDGFDNAWAIVLNKKDIYITGDTSYGPDGTKNKGDNRDAILIKR